MFKLIIHNTNKSLENRINIKINYNYLLEIRVSKILQALPWNTMIMKKNLKI